MTAKARNSGSSKKSRRRGPACSPALRKVLRQIPGYDPFATAPAGYYVDEQAARDAIEFFPTYLRHTKATSSVAAGTPFSLLPWQQAVVGNLFGWKRPNGRRRYRQVFVYVPVKNGKTTLIAGIVLLVQYTDGEAGAELYSAAADRAQALLTYEQAVAFVLNEPQLAGPAKIYHASKRLLVGSSVYTALSADAPTKHGLNAHLVGFDELHAQPNRDLYDVMMERTAARAQPIFLSITTADYDRPSICNEVYDYAVAVRDNGGDPDKPGHDPHFLPVIYEAARGADWKDPAVWRMANPSLGHTITEENLAEDCKRAQEIPAYENVFRRQRLNQRTEQETRLIPMDQWDACSTAGADGPAAWLARQRTALEGRPCFGGLDLASRNDLAAFVLWFPAERVVLPWFFVPAENAHQRESAHRAPYVTWGRAGFLTLTPGNVIDYAAIKAVIADCGRRYDLRDIGADQWNMEHLRQEVAEEGGPEFVAFGQGYRSMSEPTKELVEKILPARQLDHGGHPVLRWNAGNVQGASDAAGNLKPDKNRSREKIDGIVALIMAIGRSMVAPAEARSVYEERGPLILNF